MDIIVLFGLLILMVLMIIFWKKKKIIFWMCSFLTFLLIFVICYIFYLDYFRYQDEIIYDTSKIMYNENYTNECTLSYDARKVDWEAVSETYELKNEENIEALKNDFIFYYNQTFVVEDGSEIYVNAGVYKCNEDLLVIHIEENGDITIDEIINVHWYGTDDEDGLLIDVPLPSFFESEFNSVNDTLIYYNNYEDSIYIVEQLLGYELEVGEIYSYSATYKDISEETKKYQLEVFEDKLVFSIDD